MLLTQSLLSDEDGSDSDEQATEQQNKPRHDTREISAADAAIDFQIRLAEDSPNILEAKIIDSRTVLQSFVDSVLDIRGDGNEKAALVVFILG